MLRRVALGDGRFAGDIFAPDGVAPLARTRRLGARIKEILRVRDRGGEVLLRGAAHVRPGQVLRIARDVLRPIRAVGALGDIFEIREAQGRGRIPLGEVGLEQDLFGANASPAHGVPHVVIGALGRLLVGAAGRRPDDEASSAALLIAAQVGVELAPLRGAEAARAVGDGTVKQGEALLDLSASHTTRGLSAAPLRLSYLEYVAQGPDCPDWSENVARDPQNLPWPNMGCATQKNLAAAVADPQDLLYPRAETPRPSERRDTVWGKYVAGESTISKRDAAEHANASDISPIGGSE